MQAGRDLRFISLSMSGCFCLNALVLLVKTFSWYAGVHSNIYYLASFAVTPNLSQCQILSNRYGLQGCWFALAGFQWVRLISSTYIKFKYYFLNIFWQGNVWCSLGSVFSGPFAPSLSQWHFIQGRFRPIWATKVEDCLVLELHFICSSWYIIQIEACCLLLANVIKCVTE